MEKMKKLEYLEKTSIDSNSEFKTAFTLKPLERGFAQTLGVPLRRALLSNITSLAPFCVRIEGVDHEFQIIKDVVEDVPTILMNLRKVRFTYDPENVQDNDIVKAELIIEGTGKITARSLEVVSHGRIEVVDQAVHIATVQSEGALKLEMFMRPGRGYVPFDENKAFLQTVIDKLNTNIKRANYLAVDSNFSPVKKVAYTQRELNTASPQIEEELTIDIETDGTIRPKDALKQACEILIGHLELIGNVDRLDVDIFAVQEEEVQEKQQETDIPIDQMGLSVRSFNALKKIHKYTIGDVAQMSKEELEQTKNLGKKSLDEIEEKLKEYGLSLREGDE